MATSDFILTRNDCLDQAFRKIHVIRPGGSLALEQIEQGAAALNMILREEELHGTGLEKQLWAMSESYLILAADRFIYGATDGLPKDMIELTQVFYRNTSGDDSPVAIFSLEQHGAITDKNEKGDTREVQLKRNRDLSQQTLHIWPAPDSVGTTSEVIGSDGRSYRCVMGNTSTVADAPISGPDYLLYWVSGGAASTAWASGSSYTNGELLRLLYKRPLYDFDLPTDNPDMPAGWGRYLVYRLACDLAPEYNIQLDERTWLERQWRAAREEVFPATRSNTTDIHNKTMFY